MNADDSSTVELRCLSDVVNEIIDLTPPAETKLRAALTNHFWENCSSAPEVQDWDGVSASLRSHLTHRSDPWAVQARELWAAEPKPQTQAQASLL